MSEVKPEMIRDSSGDPGIGGFKFSGGKTIDGKPVQGLAVASDPKKMTFYAAVDADTHQRYRTRATQLGLSNAELFAYLLRIESRYAELVSQLGGGEPFAGGGKISVHYPDGGRKTYLSVDAHALITKGDNMDCDSVQAEEVDLGPLGQRGIRYTFDGGSILVYPSGKSATQMLVEAVLSASAATVVANAKRILGMLIQNDGSVPPNNIPAILDIHNKLCMTLGMDPEDVSKALGLSHATVLSWIARSALPV